MLCCLTFFSMAYAGQSSETKWSFEFSDVPISDALDEIKSKTGVDIVLKQKSDQPVMVTYSAKDQSIADILKEILRSINHTSAWIFSDDGKIKSINIVILGRRGTANKPPAEAPINQPAQKLPQNLLPKPTEAADTTGLIAPPAPPEESQ